jgi:hypothetical protein
VFERDGISVRVNLGESDWNSPISDADRLLMSSGPEIRTSGDSVCLPPSSIVILQTLVENV